MQKRTHSSSQTITTPHSFVLLQFLRTLTDFYNIWRIVYGVNLQHNIYSYTRLTYVLLLHYLGETHQLLSNNFSNQSFTLPLHKIKKCPVYPHNQTKYHNSPQAIGRRLQLQKNEISYVFGAAVQVYIINRQAYWYAVVGRSRCSFFEFQWLHDSQQFGTLLSYSAYYHVR